jgi:hypothetical protein
MAAHQHTPPEILRSIYTKPDPMGNMDVWFAENPATPRDVLDNIATKSREPTVIYRMLGNPVLDCGLFNKLSASLTAIYRDSANTEYIARDLREKRPAGCGTTGSPG